MNPTRRSSRRVHGSPSHRPHAVTFRTIASVLLIACSSVPSARAQDGPTPSWTAESDQTGAEFGYSVSTAGDVNGDGYGDVIIGAPMYDPVLLARGAAFAYLGTPSGISISPAWTATGEQSGADFGYSVSTAGDVNGDGYDDVIVGAWLQDNGETDEGRTFLYLGSSSGISTTPFWRAESDQTCAWFGHSVSTAGDVNGDGYDDVIVGAYGYRIVNFDDGRAYVYLGSPSGLSTTPAWTVDSDQTHAALGYSVSTAGDVNGDGFDDVVVGAPFYDNGESNEGRAFVYLGSSAGLSPTPAWVAESNQGTAGFGIAVSAGDVNGDGYSDVTVGAWQYANGGGAFVYLGSPSGLSMTPAWTAVSPVAVALFGARVSARGDWNGDGNHDVIVGAPVLSGDQTQEGAAFVYPGSVSGPSLQPHWTAEGNQESSRFGSSVSIAGDVNADGYDEILVGAWSYDNGQTNEGRAFAYLGSAVTGVEQSEQVVTPAHVRLDAARPNPFAAGTEIAYFLPAAAAVHLGVYDAAGRRVAKLVDGFMGPGPRLARWDGRDQSGKPAAAGIYIARIEAAGKVHAMKLVLTQ
jgi:FG-GAP repeat/FlgD Ig-like domain